MPRRSFGATRGFFPVHRIADAHTIAAWLHAGSSEEVPFRPARILMQELTCVPAMVDLAAMRDDIVALGGDPSTVGCAARDRSGSPYAAPVPD